MCSNIFDPRYEMIKNKFLRSEEGLEVIFNAFPDLILVTSLDYEIVKVNEAMASKLNMSPEECVGQKCYKLIHNLDEPKKGCPHLNLADKSLQDTFETCEPKLGGCFMVTASYLKNKGEILASIHIFRDITERVKLEKKLNKALNKKDLLMKEMNHRIKNNLTLVSSFLSLQSRFIKDANDREIFRESQTRTKAFALIHEKLYRSADLKRINLKEYLENFANEIYHTYTVDENRIKLSTDLDYIYADMDTSLPLALILNEILTNSFKYAFPNGRHGEVHIELRYLKNMHMFKLTVTDNGIGLPEDFDFKNTESFGMSVMRNLIKQIDGEVKLYKTCGTKFVIKFKDANFKS
jgi:PAS domain S-box-containing protein